MANKRIVLLIVLILGVSSCSKSAGPEDLAPPDKFDALCEYAKIGEKHLYVDGDSTHFFSISSLALNELTLDIEIDSLLFENLYPTISFDYYNEYLNTPTLDKQYSVVLGIGNNPTNYQLYGNTHFYDSNKASLDFIQKGIESNYYVSIDLSNPVYRGNTDNNNFVSSADIIFFLKNTDSTFGYRALILTINNTEYPEIFDVIQNNWGVY